MPIKPHHLFLLTALVLASFAFFNWHQGHLIDLQYHDTYFVTNKSAVFGILAFLSLITWSIYSLTHKWLFSKILAWIHVVLSIIAFFVFVYALNRNSYLYALTPSRYYAYRIEGKPAISDFNILLTYIFIAFLLTQVIFILNFILGIVKHLITKK